MGVLPERSRHSGSAACHRGAETAFPKIAQIFARTDLDTLKAWQAFHTTERAAPLLSQPFVNAQFEFRNKFLQGQPQQRERWKRGVGFAEGAMGEAIGRDYVKLYYTPELSVRWPSSW
jgi:putative endopeptidase